MSNKNNICDVPRCPNIGYITWYGKTICYEHWSKHCNETKKWNLHDVFDIDKKSIKK